MSDDKLASAFEDFMNAVNRFVCDTVRIVCANGFDLLELDMKDFDKNVYFISYPHIERGKAYEIIDEDLKLQLYHFLHQKP